MAEVQAIAGVGLVEATVVATVKAKAEWGTQVATLIITAIDLGPNTEPFEVTGWDSTNRGLSRLSQAAVDADMRMQATENALCTSLWTSEMRQTNFFDVNN